MKKSDKKIDNAIITALTEACELAKDYYDGFEWLTHFADYRFFPESLSILCVYRTNTQLQKTDTDGLLQLIHEKLSAISIDVKDIHQHVRFDTEENCDIENNGNWKERLK